MDPTSPGTFCKWPGCDAPASTQLPVRAGMSLRVGGAGFEGSAFAVCGDHEPAIAAIVLEATDEAVRRHAARTNLAPGDAEWDEYFDRDDDA